MPNYSKNIDFYQILEQKADEAVKNASKLKKHFAGEKWPSANCNPRTEVGELVEIIRE
ncbi:RloB domain-containing protein [Pseudobutyrivibrio xylanivorans]|uniref:RloB domain-containing protein n=1 Tax=Pseudobutyrivibrio xylanivorans TaxID=185007 RepID=A0A5P6VV62_PSEXY|nr:RloB domain-containing protein [Pseudobutyrivibrio xylanivorans]